MTEQTGGSGPAKTTVPSWTVPVALLVIGGLLVALIAAVVGSDGGKAKNHSPAWLQGQDFGLTLVPNMDGSTLSDDNRRSAVFTYICEPEQMGAQWNQGCIEGSMEAWKAQGWE